MRRFLVLVFASLLVFVCCAPSFSADFVEYAPQNPEDPYSPAPLSFDTPSILSYYYYPDQQARPNLYVYGGTYWGLTGTNTFEHSQHAGEDYVSWATYRVNYQLYLNDGTESSIPWKMQRVRLQVASPLSGTEVRVSGFSDNINLAVQGVLDSNKKVSMDVYPVDTLFIPQDSGTRFSFWIDFTVMFNPSVPVSDLIDYGTSNSPVLPIMDADGFQPRLVSYIPAESMGGSSAAGQQQIDQSINQQTQQQEQQYNDFTESGDGSIFNDAENDVREKLGLFEALEELLETIWSVFSAPVGAPTLTFPAFALTVEGVQYQLWSEHVFNFNVINNSWGLSALKTALNFATVFAVYAGLLRYLIRVWETIMGKEYIHGGDYF